MARDTDFDFEAYREYLIDAGIEATREWMDDDAYRPDEALSEAAFEVPDEYIAYRADTDDLLAILRLSENEPSEYEPFIEGKDLWEEIIQGIAFTVIRQDLYDFLEAEGYLDDHWNPTDKLTEGDE